MTDADAPNTSAILVALEGGGGHIGFQWNPHKIKESKKIKWNQLRVAGREQPILQYGCGEARVLTIVFHVSRYNRGDGNVKSTVDKIFALTKPTVGGFVKRPPRCEFILGEAIKFTCYVQSIDVEYGPLYNPTSLLPYMATVTITLEEAK
jgi:hypothetical protein